AGKIRSTFAALPPGSRGDAVEHGRDRGGPAPRRHDVRPGHARNLPQPLYQLRADHLPLFRRRGRVLEPLDHGARDVDAEQVLVHPAGGFRRAYRPDADDDAQALGQALAAQPLDVALRDAEVKAELCLHESGSGIRLAEEALRAPVGPRVLRDIRPADEELRGWVDLAPRRQLAPLLHVPDERHQLAGVQIEYRLRVRLVAPAGIVSMQDQQVTHALSARAEQV